MIETVKKALSALKLKGFADNLVFRNEQALKGNMSHIEFLHCLIEDEKIRRDSKAYLIRLKASGVNPSKTLDNFDFAFQPSIDKQQMLELARCEFIRKKGKLLFVGISGSGKSHCVAAIGLKAIEKGFHVLRFKSNKLVDELLKTKRAGTQDSFIKRIMKADFVIMDEFALRPYPEGGTAELQGLLDDLDEHAAVAITTNRDFIDWEPFFDDKTIASAFTDRAVHDGSIIRITGGRSYRTRNYERKELDDQIAKNSKDLPLNGKN
jgi:DNA replication protein DnaC